MAANSMFRYSGTGPNGRRLCCWCGTEVPKGRRNWCSQVCVDDYLGTKGHAHLIGRIFKRDKGVCAKCGLDTVAYRNAWRSCREFVRHPVNGHLVQVLELFGWDCSKRWWEADHILERHDDGPNTLQNLQTLCQLCHKVKTREFAARRARRRKLAIQPELFCIAA
jgi:5-methylcytosine-specific restriction enzyme A